MEKRVAALFNSCSPKRLASFTRRDLGRMASFLAFGSLLPRAATLCVSGADRAGPAQPT